MKYTLLSIALAPWLIAIFVTGCSTAQIAETDNIVSDIVTDVQAGAVTYIDAQTALKAAQQTMGGHGISLNNIGTYALAETASANTSGLLAASATLENDIASQLANGVTPAAITTQLTTAQTTLTPTGN